MEEFKLCPDESILFDLTPEDVTLLFYVSALAVAQPLTIDEIEVLANGLFEMAQVMFVIAAQRTLINDVIKAHQENAAAKKANKKENSLENLKSEIKKLQDQIEHLQQQIHALQK